MNNKTFTVRISFVSSDKENRTPIPGADVFVEIPLGLPLPCVGDRIALDDTPYTILSRALMLSNDAERKAFWNLLVEKTI